MIAFGAIPDGPVDAYINFGQQPFLYKPAGFEALQTQNLPAAKIVDGREHFRAITGPGQGADSGVAGQLAGNWSSMVTNPDGWGTGLSGLASWFDGNLSSAALSNGSGPVTFSPGIDYTTGVRIMFNGTSAGDFKIDFNAQGEVNVPAGNDSWERGTPSPPDQEHLNQLQ